MTSWFSCLYWVVFFLFVFESGSPYGALAGLKQTRLVSNHRYLPASTNGIKAHATISALPIPSFWSDFYTTPNSTFCLFFGVRDWTLHMLGSLSPSYIPNPEVLSVWMWVGVRTTLRSLFSPAALWDSFSYCCRLAGPQASGWFCLCL